MRSHFRTLHRRMGAMAAIGTMALLMAVAPAFSATMLTAEDFVTVAEDGFGDDMNSIAWSMRWFKGNLYVGTLRANYCVQQANVVHWLPEFGWLYPPSNPLFDCTESPQDLPVRAEIWRWSPELSQWDRVYQSPQDVDIPGHPGKTIARDIGFRTMEVFTEEDGTEALYVGGICSLGYNPGVPAPRLLRSVDGETFEPVPQEPGSFLESLLVDGFPYNGFRSLQSYDGRLFSVASEGFAGHGGLIVSDHPEQGSDAWQFAAKENQVYYQLANYNGYLYAGRASENGFTVVKTDAQGDPPFKFKTVIPEGGYLTPDPSVAVVSLFEYRGRLYVGMDRPPDLYRINPDDSWELVVGEPRWTPDGYMRPLSGLGSGFDNEKNIHMWRMQDAFGSLYTGTMDTSTKSTDIIYYKTLYAPEAGFDMYGTPKGHYFTMVTRSGLLTKWDEGLRQFAYSPEHGLTAGSQNNRFGCNIWQAFPDPARIQPPQRVDGEAIVGSYVLLTWTAPPGAKKYHVYRSVLTGTDRSFRYLGATTDSYFVNQVDLFTSGPIHYHVLAEDASGDMSGPSNVVRMPNLGQLPTLFSVRSYLVDWNVDPARLAEYDAAMKVVFWRGDYAAARKILGSIRRDLLNDPSGLNPQWRVEDAEILLSKLIRRSQLAEFGVIPWWRLFI